MSEIQVVLSQTAEYALRAMARLAVTPDRLVSTAELAERTHVPPHYLAKVLQQLAAGDLISGRRGVGGGYRLARPPADISLLDVINVVSPMRRMDACPLPNADGAPETLCALHRRADEAIGSAIDVFDRHTLQSLLDDDYASLLCGGANATNAGRESGVNPASPGPRSPARPAESA